MDYREGYLELLAERSTLKGKNEALVAALKRTLTHAIGHACDARGMSREECYDWPWVQQAREAIAKATEGE